MAVPSDADGMPVPCGGGGVPGGVVVGGGGGVVTGNGVMNALVADHGPVVLASRARTRQ